MNIVITGGAGFLGARLARTLLARPALALDGAPAQALARLSLVDAVAPPADLLHDPRVEARVGDLGRLLQDPAAVVPHGTDAVVHLAAAVSAECEADFDLGWRSNLEATRGLLEACRRLAPAGAGAGAGAGAPLFVFASSLAVFGAEPGRPLPATVGDDTLPTPQSSYGIQKFIGEQLVADYTRKGFVRGRSVRLMTVSVRPGRPNGAASGFLSGIIREPLAGLRAVCPVPPQTRVALSSPARSVEGLVCALESSSARWGGRRALNLPALSLSVAEMVEALARVAGPAVAARIDWVPDPALARIVTSWPAQIDSPRAQALGLQADPDFDAIVRAHVRENPDAVAAGTVSQ